MSLPEPGEQLALRSRCTRRRADVRGERAAASAGRLMGSAARQDAARPATGRRSRCQRASAGKESSCTCAGCPSSRAVPPPPQGSTDDQHARSDPRTTSTSRRSADRRASPPCRPSRLRSTPRAGRTSPAVPDGRLRAAVARRLFAGVATACRAGHPARRRGLRRRTRPAIPVMRLVRPDAFYRRLGAGGLIGFGEAYMAGDWDADDLAGLLTVFAREMATLIPAAPAAAARPRRAAPAPAAPRRRRARASATSPTTTTCRTSSSRSSSTRR